MKRLELIIEVTYGCNLRCKYCYHANTNYVCGRLGMEKIKRLFDLASDEYKTIKIIWHGGEPMLLGRDFYKKLLDYQRKLEMRKRVTFHNTMQTNGTLIDLWWALFFKKFKIQPGISFDGPTNDTYREKSKAVLNGINTLRFCKVDVGCLAVINRNNIDQIALYNSMKEYSTSLKFNPVFSEDKDPDFQIDINEYIKGSIEVFNHWLYDKKGIPLDPFTTYMAKALKLPNSSCANASCLGRWLDIDSKGVIRTCGQSQNEQFTIGHLDEIEKLSDVFNSDAFNNLLEKAINRRESCKAHCPLFLECQGGCIFKAHIENGIENNDGFTCKAFKSIYSYVKHKTIELIKNNVNLDTLNPAAKEVITNALTNNPKFITGIIND